MIRPPVDVVVPFRGEATELEDLRTRLGGLHLRSGDSLLVVDNTPETDVPAPSGADGVPVLSAAEVATPGFARNRGAAHGGADWILFLDADTVAPADLLDLYFDPPPPERTGLLGGGVLDEAVPAGGGAAARYGYLRAVASQEGTLRFGRWGYPKTTNAAFRRVAFEEAGGFREEIRAGEDADLTYRLRAVGWDVERRDAAAVVHRNRQTARGFMAQRAVHGAGAAWLEAEYPGSFPARHRPGLVWWGVRTAARGLVSAAVSRDRDRAVRAAFEPLDDLLFEFGRSMPNERPLPAHSPWRPLLSRGGA